MYSKDDLLSKDIAELVGIADQIGADHKSSDSQETLIYSILDRQAIVEGSKSSAAPKRKRTRIAKKETDRVYSVNGKDGENFDTKKNKSAANEPLPLFKDEIPDSKTSKNETAVSSAEIAVESVPAPAPKKRGRKSKAEKEAIAAAERAAREAEEAAKAAEEAAKAAEEATNATEEADVANQEVTATIDDAEYTTSPSDDAAVLLFL